MVYIDVAMDKYKVPSNSHYFYGTTGFRMKAELMEPVVYRMGVLVAALSANDEGKIYGIMLTASHNPIEDNGVKIIAPDGGILPSQWELVAEELASTPLDGILTFIERHFRSLGQKSRIALGKDTRPSGSLLVKAAQEGAAIFKAEIMDLDVVTTPECHAAVATLNKSDLRLGAVHLQNKYLDSLAGKFMNLMGATESKGLRSSFSSRPPVIVDGANGVGAKKLALLTDKLSCRYFQLVNDGTNPEDVLNEGCGADFIKTFRKAPRLDPSLLKPWGHFAALDGDADRLIYFTFDEKLEFRLIDGDKIGALFVLTIKSLLDRIGLSLSMGAVQTAYANGSATEYIAKTLGIPVIFTSTGVKHLHEAASLNFDIGIYFEANGHGTLLVKPSVTDALLDLTLGQETGNVKALVGEAARTLLQLIGLANHLVGDGIADLLLVEVMLHILNLDIKGWSSLYQERPSALIKMTVRDRTRLATTDADRKIINPPGLQNEIDQLISEGCRTFARPSGTEDVVRIYAEAPTMEKAQQLADQAKSLILKYNL